MFQVKGIFQAALAPLTALAVAGSIFGATAGSAGAVAQPVIMTAPESQLMAELNADRAANGEGPLAGNGVLAGIARQRSQMIAASGNFTHYAADGSLVFAGMLNGIAFPYSFAGENLAENNYSWPVSLDEANTQLMNSPTHRANILSPKYNEVGIGIAGPTPDGKFYYTQIFAAAW